MRQNYIFRYTKAKRDYYLWILTERTNKKCLSAGPKRKPAGMHEIFFNGVLKINENKFNQY